MRLEGHVAIVTGLSHAGQVSYALTPAFAREGAHLAISARSAKRVHARAEELRGAGAKVMVVPADPPSILIAIGCNPGRERDLLIGTRRSTPPRPHLFLEAELRC
jgi:NAD(P)-dependent dehydrogenase (short-subunit alcohol dehydrogenase family)